MSNFLEEPSVSSENSIEDSNPQVKTNLNRKQLVFFQRYDGDSKSNLSICSYGNPIRIKFPEKYLNHFVSISLIGPDRDDDEHDMLKLVPLPKRDYPIRNKEIVFKITKNRLNLKLDFFGIQFLNVKKNNADDIDINKEAYKRNTARLLIDIYDRLEKPCLRYRSQMIRNTNFLDLEVSKDICIRTIKMEECQCLIEFTHHVPYFANEIKIKINGEDEDYTPITHDDFPIKNIIIKKPSKTQLNASDFCVSTDFSKSGICFLINQIKFDKLKSLKKGSKIDNEKIKEVFTTTLNYDVRPLISCRTKELEDKIEKILDDVQNYKHEHIVVFARSHGVNKGFFTRDGYIEFDDFVKIFRQKFTDKPIIFFFCCCQGEKDNILLRSCNNSANSATSEGPFFKIKDPNSANTFMGFGTVPGYYDNCSEKGAPYIQILLQVIEKNPKLEIPQIHKITQITMREIWEKVKQISCYYGLTGGSPVHFIVPIES